LGLDIAKHVRSGRIRLQQLDPAEVSPGEFVHRVRGLVEDRETKLLVIDSLNGFLNAMPGEGFLTLQLHEMLSYLNQQGLNTVLTLAQHGLLGSVMESPLDVSYLADTVLLFRYFEAEGELRQAISVLKKRSGKHERAIRALSFQDGSITVGPPLRNFQGVMTGVPQAIGESRLPAGGPRT
jgi:circadian clock protein KaiC